MAPSSSSQLENIFSATLKSGDVRPLEVFLETNTHKDISIKCSQEFLSKLDKLVTKSLDQKEITSASLGLASLYKCGRNLKLPSGEGLSGLISQGLIKKIIQWFEKCRKLWIQHGPRWDEAIFSLCENFLNALMVAHESCKEGISEVTKSFLYPVGQLAVDPRIHILIQKEAIRKYNTMLDKIPMEFKKNRRILASQEASDIMTKLACRIQEGGDYDLQSSQMEALCRMATPDQRRKLADRWFSMGHVASAFGQISDSEFETACRRFLNMVNGMQGDKRRVYSYPCLKVCLGRFELLMPSDEKLEEFWIDFNLGSSSISFYFSLPNEEESHWETICINENEVQSYSVTEVGKRQVLQIKLLEVVVVDSVEGSSLAICFSSSLDILQAARNVFGDDKNKSNLVVKTAVKPTLAGNSTQMVTPARQRLSHSKIFIGSSEGGSVNTGSFLPAKNKGRASVAKVSVCGTAITASSVNTTPCSTNRLDKNEQKMPLAKAEDVIFSGQGEEKSQEANFVPDTQPRAASNTSTNWSKLSISEMLTMPTQKMGSLPIPEPDSSVLAPQQRCPSSGQKWSVSDSSFVLHKRFHNELTERLEKVLNDRSKDPPPQESTDRQSTMANSKRGSEERNPGNLCGSVHVSKSQKAQRSKRFKEKRKEQMSPEADVGPTKSLDKAFTNKTVQGQKKSEERDYTKLAISSKEKRDSEGTASMMKLISSHYESKTQNTRKNTVEKMTLNWIPSIINRPIFNKEIMPACKKEKLGAVSLRKSLNSITASVRSGKDRFAFNVDSPVCIGEGNQSFAKSLVTSSSCNSSTLLITTKKEQPVAKHKLHVKKHLFSDTDTDHTSTDVSWLRESCRKPKPRVINYSRQPQLKTVPPQSPEITPVIQSVSSKAVKDNSKLTQKAVNHPKAAKQATAPSRTHGPAKRPRRVAATATKSYKEPDTDESGSETEKPQSTKATTCFSLSQHSSTDDTKNSEKTTEVAPAKKKKTASKQPAKIKVPTECVLDVYPSSNAEVASVGQQRDKEDYAEDPPVKKSKTSLSDHPADKYRGTESSNLHDSKKTGFKVIARSDPQETLMLNKGNVIPGQEQARALKGSLAACQASLGPSPPPIEKMRSAERSAPTLGLTCSTVLTLRGSPLPNSPCQDNPSPIQLLPKDRLTVSSKGQRKLSSFHDAAKKTSKTPSIQSVPSACSPACQTPAPSPPTGLTAAEMCAVQTHLSSAPQSLLSTKPLLTSTLLELDKPPVPSPPQSPFPGDSLTNGCHLDFSKVSSVSLGSLSQSSLQSSVLSGKIKESSTGVLNMSFKENTPITDKDLELTHHLVSGPSRKRCVSTPRNPEEEEKKKSKIRAQRSPRMKPRKLFKSFAEVSVVDERSHVSCSHWEAEEVDADMEEDSELPEQTLNPNNLCQQLSSELKNKFQNHCKMVEIYNKQSSKAVQQHISSIGAQLKKNRVQRLSQVQNILLEEIQKMELDDNMLKSMEKDLTVGHLNLFLPVSLSLLERCEAIYWKKQMMTFHSYQKQESKSDRPIFFLLFISLFLLFLSSPMFYSPSLFVCVPFPSRNDTLRRTLQSVSGHNWDYEEGLFKSEMCLVKKDMKSIQDRLLSEMHEGEIQSVKRGLHALFFP
ncbi:uncharacterized protein sycp2 [Fundulus diaphanus]